MPGFAVVAAFGLFLPEQACSQIIADFAGGGSTAAPVTNQVDAWTGMAGDGWQTDWSFTSTGNVTRVAEVLDSAPLTPGENYLQFSTINTSPTLVRTGAVHRQYDSVSMGLQQTVSFQFRLDSALTTVDRIRIFDNQSANLTEATGITSWYIRGSGGTWRVHNGTSSVDTGMSLVAGNIYDFSVQIANDTYSVTINDLTAETSYTSGTLDFYSDSATTAGGYLNFSLATPANLTATASLGGIQIIPEPSAASAVFLGMLLLGGRRYDVDSRNTTR